VEVSTGKPENKVGRGVRKCNSNVLGGGGGDHTHTHTDVMKCKWNNVVFNIPSFCNNKLEIKTKFHCFIHVYFLKSSGSFALCVRLRTPEQLTIWITCLYDSNL
jgi:hypothetical protein